MLPRLQAEEQIAAVRTAALGAGIYPEQEQAAMLRRLEERASGGAQPRPKKARASDLAAMGIGVVAVPAPGVSKPSEKGVSDV